MLETIVAGSTEKTMQITYTQHALSRMAERNISKLEVEATLAAPERSLPAAGGRMEFQGFIDRAGKRQLMRVLVEGSVVVLVITVMATSKLEKYGVNS